MTGTEEEAKTKWCPMARVCRTHGESAYNRQGSAYRGMPPSYPAGGECIASGCMAWRWTNEVTGRGFCGLAGNPLA